MASKSRVVITGTAYNLLLNLLIIPDDELNRVLYITCDSIPYSIRKKLNNNKFIPNMHHIGKMRKLKYLLQYRLFAFVFCPDLIISRIYAQDHLPYMPIIVGNRHYAFTEDGPNVFKVNEKFSYVINAWRHYESSGHNKSLKARILDPIQGGLFARNPLCDEIVISEATIGYLPDYVKGKKVTVVNMAEEWGRSSLEKRNYILNIFSITSEDIKMMASRHVVVFTQPFYEDGDVPTLEDHIEVYRKLMADYDLNDVIIKTHPRETTNYQRFFPEVCVFNKPVPFQLLDLLGLKFQEAATVCSTAVLSIPYSIKINWAGARIHPGILKEYGDFIPEQIQNKA